MMRFRLMRAAVGGMERASHATFRAMRWGIDQLERRSQTHPAAAEPTLPDEPVAHPSAGPVDAAPHGDPVVDDSEQLPS